MRLGIFQKNALTLSGVWGGILQPTPTHPGHVLASVSPTIPHEIYTIFLLYCPLPFPILGIRGDKSLEVSEWMQVGTHCQSATRSNCSSWPYRWASPAQWISATWEWVLVEWRNHKQFIHLSHNFADPSHPGLCTVVFPVCVNIKEIASWKAKGYGMFCVHAGLFHFEDGIPGPRRSIDGLENKSLLCAPHHSKLTDLPDKENINYALEIMFLYWKWNLIDFFKA